MSKNFNKYLVDFLDRSHAHIDLESVLERIPTALRNEPIEGLPYTLWELLEHIRLAQRDILDYMIDPDYQPGCFPDDYWPKQGARMLWSKTIKELQGDLEQIKSLVNDVNPLEQLPYGKRGHTYLREILILIDHQSYHLGQMVVILRLHGLKW